MTDEELLRSFEDCTLPYEAWTHRAHVKVAFLYLRDRDFHEALALIRSGIKRFNASKNVLEGTNMGYCETTTCAFSQIIAATIGSYGETVPALDADAFCDAHPHLLTRHVLRLFYSPERRLDPRAKTEFLEPDLAPLPRVTK